MTHSTMFPADICFAKPKFSFSWQTSVSSNFRAQFDQSGYVMKFALISFVIKFWFQLGQTSV